MANLTITISDEVLKKARMRAIEQGTSVNAILREYLGQYAGARALHQEAVDNLLKLSRSSDTGRGRRKWSRDELHER